MAGRRSTPSTGPDADRGAPPGAAARGPRAGPAARGRRVTGPDRRRSRLTSTHVRGSHER